MDKLKNNVTGLVLATIISLLTIVTMVGTFISNQTKLEVQLINIQKDVLEIKQVLKEDQSKRDDEIKGLTERVIRLEEKR